MEQNLWIQHSHGWSFGIKPKTGSVEETQGTTLQRLNKAPEVQKRSLSR
jgi:hypothetical protein